LLFQTPS